MTADLWQVTLTYLLFNLLGNTISLFAKPLVTLIGHRDYIFPGKDTADLALQRAAALTTDPRQVDLLQVAREENLQSKIAAAADSRASIAKWADGVNQIGLMFRWCGASVALSLALLNHVLSTRS
jgi:hypothetical protein